MRIGRYNIKITNEDKVLFPDDGITKGDLIDYYRKIANVMMPYMKARPVVMERYPDGIGEDGFYHKNEPDFFPDWIHTTTVKKEGGRVKHVICDNAASLVYLANSACITPHTWLSTEDKLDNPDQLIFDLDPPGHDFKIVLFAAKALRELLKELGLYCLIKTTGSRGLHVMVPLNRRADFKTARSFAQNVATVLAARHSKELTTEVHLNKRQGKLFLDTARNAYAQTAAPAYAVRAHAGAPVSTPLEWDELDRSGINSQSFNIRNIFDRLAKTPDVWKGWRKHAASLTEPIKRLTRLLKDSQGR